MTAAASHKTDAFAQPGATIAGKYEVVERLGEGGMGVVVAARHVHLGQMVAIKLLHPKASSDEQAVGRFQREGRAAAALRSDHVAKTLDIGWTDDGAPFLVMEFLEGNDLGQELRKSGRLPVADAAGYVLQACEAMAEAHSLGIIHRDLKPSNLFLAAHPSGARTVKVLDFGISKLAPSSDPSEQALTTTMATLGTPLYMSPEQMRSAKSVDARTDIWSLGAILYELIAGEPPFRAGSLPELCARILTAEPEPLSGKRPEVPEALARVIHACLSKAPEGRPQTVADLADALRPFAPASVRDITITRGLPLPSLAGDLAQGQPQGRSDAAGTSQGGRPSGSLEQTGSAASTARTLAGREPASTRRPAWAIVAAAALCAVAAAGVVLSRGQSPVPPGNSQAGSLTSATGTSAASATGTSAATAATAATAAASGEPAASPPPSPLPALPPASAPSGVSAGHAPASEPTSSAKGAGKAAPATKGPGPRPAGQANDDPTKSRQF